MSEQKTCERKGCDEPTNSMNQKAMVWSGYCSPYCENKTEQQTQCWTTIVEATSEEEAREMILNGDFHLFINEESQ